MKSNNNSLFTHSISFHLSNYTDRKGSYSNCYVEMGWLISYKERE